MKILGINRPPIGPIGSKPNIKICSKCDAILEYNYEDMWVKTMKDGYEINHITCPSCNESIVVSDKFYNKDIRD